MERQKTLTKFIKEKEFGDDIIGDGNCYYRCLAKILYGSQQWHERIRHEIIQYMSDDELMPKEEKINRYYRKFMSKNDGYDDYLTLHSKIGEWAEAPMIQASADKYCLYIFVLFFTNQKEVIRMVAKPVQAERKNYKSISLNLENNHYTIKAKDLKVSPEEPWFDLLGLPADGPEQYEYSSLALDYNKCFTKQRQFEQIYNLKYIDQYELPDEDWFDLLFSLEDGTEKFDECESLDLDNWKNIILYGYRRSNRIKEFEREKIITKELKKKWNFKVFEEPTWDVNYIANHIADENLPEKNGLV